MLFKLYADSKYSLRIGFVGSLIFLPGKLIENNRDYYMAKFQWLFITVAFFKEKK
jgi:hypothetical protein